MNWDCFVKQFFLPPLFQSILQIVNRLYQLLYYLLATLEALQNVTINVTPFSSTLTVLLIMILLYCLIGTRYIFFLYSSSVIYFYLSCKFQNCEHTFQASCLLPLYNPICNSNTGKHVIGITYVKNTLGSDLKCYTFAFFLFLKNSKHIIHTTYKALQKHSVDLFVSSLSYSHKTHTES